ncbi:LPS assembly lipoprotein LptE [Legionella longbeachae]|uniref:LPS-assembly lipoprotein LptE n=1 Tax=Legionella longbeachae serogroup 1 (strain NSW150) TaxID=661367 RepID=D3HJZ3_LEGLN|nr:LPS assembly lipoprotein LptE [Legionella longbeachae]VEE03273.1 Rare lipoprotein B [Legionella oakridgensis]HBD7398555.1 hypothetical protein [Legionella pneumophila]ARB93829.1 hypothetical protein A6J40_17325 [Legionella longbeachae]ARM33031.1 hypothetical protein B0B39_05630 [Legionella longbeachae]EEZ94135.1 rare lipoprotein B family protein [Legionella longbeachae D-4968]
MKYSYSKFQSLILQGIITVALISFLPACGFHLRGVSNVPSWLNNIALISENNDKQFISIIESRLEGSKIQINEPSHAQYWLLINEVNLQQQIISVGASTNPRQYTLTLTVIYILKTRKGQELTPPSRVSVSRQLTLNNDRILGSKDEESILIGEMKQDAVTQILYRLSHLQKPSF